VADHRRIKRRAAGAFGFAESAQADVCDYIEKTSSLAHVAWNDHPRTFHL